MNHDLSLLLIQESDVKDWKSLALVCKGWFRIFVDHPKSVSEKKYKDDHTRLQLIKFYSIKSLIIHQTLIENDKEPIGTQFVADLIKLREFDLIDEILLNIEFVKIDPLKRLIKTHPVTDAIFWHTDETDFQMCCKKYLHLFFTNYDFINYDNKSIVFLKMIHDVPHPGSIDERLIPMIYNRLKTTTLYYNGGLLLEFIGKFYPRLHDAIQHEEKLKAVRRFLRWNHFPDTILFIRKNEPDFFKSLIIDGTCCNNLFFWSCLNDIQDDVVPLLLQKIKESNPGKSLTHLISYPSIHLKNHKIQNIINHKDLIDQNFFNLYIIHFAKDLVIIDKHLHHDVSISWRYLGVFPNSRNLWHVYKKYPSMFNECNSHIVCLVETYQKDYPDFAINDQHMGKVLTELLHFRAWNWGELKKINENNESFVDLLASQLHTELGFSCTVRNEFFELFFDSCVKSLQMHSPFITSNLIHNLHRLRSDFRQFTMMLFRLRNASKLEIIFDVRHVLSLDDALWLINYILSNESDMMQKDFTRSFLIDLCIKFGQFNVIRQLCKRYSTPTICHHCNIGNSGYRYQADASLYQSLNIDQKKILERCHESFVHTFVSCLNIRNAYRSFYT